MICDQCLNETKSFCWRNNMRLCKVCLHNAQPWKKKRCTDDSCPAPTLLDLKKKWEKK
jgi:hypothetical protein